MIQYVDDAARVVALLAFLYFTVRFLTSSQWWTHFDTTAIAVLCGVCGGVLAFAIGANAGWFDGSRDYIAAAIYVVIAAAALFLAVGYEVEQRRARRARRARVMTHPSDGSKGPGFSEHGHAQHP